MTLGPHLKSVLNRCARDGTRVYTIDVICEDEGTTDFIWAEQRSSVCKTLVFQHNRSGPCRSMELAAKRTGWTAGGEKPSDVRDDTKT